VSAARRALAAGRLVVFYEKLVWPDGRVHLRVLRDDNGDQQSPAPAASAADTFPATVVRLAHPYSGPVLPPSVTAPAKLPVTVEYILLTAPATSQASQELATADVVDVGLGTEGLSDADIARAMGTSWSPCAATCTADWRGCACCWRNRG
jgi:hypothetical protein